MSYQLSSLSRLQGSLVTLTLSVIEKELQIQRLQKRSECLEQDNRELETKFNDQEKRHAEEWQRLFQQSLTTFSTVPLQQSASSDSGSTSAALPESIQLAGFKTRVSELESYNQSLSQENIVLSRELDDTKHKMKEHEKQIQQLRKQVIDSKHYWTNTQY
jgi:hypothetical protein